MRNFNRLMRFAIAYPGWQSYGKDKSTVGAINALARRGFIEVNRETRQFRLALDESNYKALNRGFKEYVADA